MLDVPNVGWVDAAARDQLGDALRAHFAADDTLLTAAFKDLTGLSRKGAIPWLEWLDAHKWTQRDGDLRRRGAAL